MKQRGEDMSIGDILLAVGIPIGTLILVLLLLYFGGNHRGNVREENQRNAEEQV